jgi:hypothetical protein
VCGHGLRVHRDDSPPPKTRAAKLNDARSDDDAVNCPQLERDTMAAHPLARKTMSTTQIGRIE